MATITKTANVILVRLEEADWKAEWKEFINSLKESCK